MKDIKKLERIWYNSQKLLSDSELKWWLEIESEFFKIGENGNLKEFNEMIAYVTTTPFCITRIKALNEITDKFKEKLK